MSRKRRNQKKKKKKSNKKLPAHLRAASLRPRIDRTLTTQLFSERDQAGLFRMIDRLAKGVELEVFLSTLMRACLDRRELALYDTMVTSLVAWIEERGHEGVLENLATEWTVEPSVQQLAREWLAEMGVDVDSLEMESEDLFFGANIFDNEFQGWLSILFYTNRHRTRVDGLGFLLDYHPPWEGAVKDVIHYPTRPAETFMDDVIAEVSKGVPGPMEELDAEEAKEKLLMALETNRTQGIRLPKDLPAERIYFARRILSLPDGPYTPPFTIEDFDRLTHQGHSVEKIREIEQNVGSLARTEDGETILMPGFNDEFWED